MNLLRIAPCLLLFAVICGLAGCSANDKVATCGWQTSIPSSGNAICNATYRDLNKVIHAMTIGDARGVHAYVGSAGVAKRIMAFGRYLRKRDLKFARVSNDPTIGVNSHGRYSVTFYIIGSDNAGKIDQYDSIVEKVANGSIRIVSDSPISDWINGSTGIQ